MIPAQATLPNVSKMAIIRSGAIGDILVATPAILSLRNAYPGAEIVLLTSSTGIELGDKGRIPVNRCIELPVFDGLNASSTSAVDEKEFIQQMRDEQFDLMINFQGRGKAANAVMRDIRPGLTVSFRGSDVADTDLSVPYRYYQSELLRCLEVAELAGAKPTLWEPSLRLLREDIELAQRVAPRSGTSPSIVISPFASDRRREWPIDMYVPVISALQEEGYKVILGGSRKQRNALDALNAETGSECLNVAGELSIPGFAALLRTSLLLIAPDSGPLHLARSVNTPTVGLYWAPNLINWGPLSRGIHRALISWQMQCPLCGLVPNQPFPFEPQNECEHLVSFVRDITPEEVMNEAFEILHLIPKNSVT